MPPTTTSAPANESDPWVPTHEVVLVHSADRITVARLPPPDAGDTTVANRAGWIGDTRHWEELVLTDVRPFVAVPFGGSSSAAPSPSTNIGSSPGPSMPGTSAGFNSRAGSLTAADFAAPSPLSAGGGTSAQDQTTPGFSFGVASRVVSSAATITLDAPYSPAADPTGSSASPSDLYPAGEPFGIEARDYLRKHFLGKRVQIDRGNGTSRFAVIYRERDGASPAMMLVKQGFAAVRPVAVRSADASEWTQALVRSELGARTQRLGMHTLRPLIEFIHRTRRFPMTAEQRFALGSFAVTSTASPFVLVHRGQTSSGGAVDPSDLTDDEDAARSMVVSALVGNLVNCTVEDISDSGVLRLVTATGSHQELFLRLAGVFAFTSAAFADLRIEAIATLRSSLLHRSYNFDLCAFDAKSGCFVGGFENQCSALEWLLAHGRVAVDRRTVNLIPRRSAFDSHERAAAAEQRGVWAPALLPQHPPFLRDARPFTGTVIGVMSGRTVLVLPDAAAPPGGVDSAMPASAVARVVHLAFVAVDEPRHHKALDVGDVVQHTSRFLHGRDFLRGMLMRRRVEVAPITINPSRVPGGATAVIGQVFALPPPSPAAIDQATPPPAPLDAAEALAFAGLCDLDRVHLAPLALALAPPPGLLQAVEAGNQMRLDAENAASANAPVVSLGSDGAPPPQQQQQQQSYTDSRPVGILAEDVATAAAAGDDDDSDGDLPLLDFGTDFPAAAQAGPIGSPPTVATAGSQDLMFGAIGGSSAPADDHLAPGATVPLVVGDGDLLSATVPGVGVLPGAAPAAMPPQIDEEPVNVVVDTPATVHNILYARADRTALGRLDLPEGTPLASSVEQVDVAKRLLWLHIVPFRVVVPATLAGVALPVGYPGADHRLEALLHSRVDAVVCGVVGASIAITVHVPAPPPPPAAEDVAASSEGGAGEPAVINVNLDLLAAGCGLARGLHVLHSPDEIVAFHAAEAAARDAGAGIWAPDAIDRTSAFLARVDGGTRPLVDAGPPLDTTNAKHRMPRDILPRRPGTLSNCRLIGANAENGTLILEDTAGVPGFATPAQLREKLRQAANAVPNFQLRRLESPDEAFGRAVIVAGPLLRGAPPEVSNENDTDVEWLRGRVVDVPGPELVGVRALDTPEVGVVHLSHVFFLDEPRFTEWRSVAVDADGQPTADELSGARRSSRNAKKGQPSATSGAWAITNDEARALAFLLDTPPLVFEARLAFVEIDRRTPRVDALLDRLACPHDDPALPRAQLMYVRYGIPYMCIFSSEERRAGHGAPFSIPLLVGTSDDEVFVDVGLLDVPELVDGVVRLRMEPREQPMECPADGALEQHELGPAKAGTAAPEQQQQQRRGKDQRKQGVRDTAAARKKHQQREQPPVPTPASAAAPGVVPAKGPTDPSAKPASLKPKAKRADKQPASGTSPVAAAPAAVAVAVEPTTKPPPSAKPTKVPKRSSNPPPAATPPSVPAADSAPVKTVPPAAAVATKPQGKHRDEPAAARGKASRKQGGAVSTTAAATAVVPAKNATASPAAAENKWQDW